MLESSELTVAFGGVYALRNVSFRSEPGIILGLIGPNGAGKSTFINCVTGTLLPTSGYIKWRGDRLTGLRPDQIADRGISRTFQHARLFAGLTALENVMVGAHRTGRSGAIGAMFRSRSWRRDERSMVAAATEALATVHADGLSGTPAQDLTAGQQRLVAIARALVSAPEMLLLDEPAAGLTDVETDLLLRDMRAYLHERAITALIVEHNLGFLMSLANRVVVFDQGSVLSEGTPAEIRRDPAVIKAYLGADSVES